MKYETREKLLTIFKGLYLEYEQHILNRAEEIKHYRRIDEKKLLDEYDEKEEILRMQANLDGEYDAIVYTLQSAETQKYDIKTLLTLFSDIVHDIKALEKERNKIILRRCPKSCSVKKMYNTNGYYRIAKIFTITVFHGTITIEEVNEILQRNRKKLKSLCRFYYYVQRYETEDYQECGEKFYLENAIEYAEKESKFKEDVI